MRVCAFGSFDREFDRSWILLEALEQSGIEVVYCHFDLWAGRRHKTKLFPWRWVLLAGRYLAGMISIARQFRRSPRCDVLYVGYMGHVDLLFATLLNRQRRSTLVFDPCISLYNTLVEDRRMVGEGSLVARIIRRLDVIPCRLADLVLSDTRSHGEYFQKVLGVPSEKLHRVFVGAGLDWQHTEWRPHTDGRFEVLFFAKFSPLHGLPVILEAVERLKAEPIHFTIVGGGQLEDEVRQAVARSRSSALEWIPWLERHALIERVRGCHLCLGVFGTTTKAAMVIPNKVFQALAMGVPVVTRDSPAIWELLEDGQSMFTCEPDGALLATTILTCRRNFDGVMAVAERGRKVFRKCASHQAIARQFLEAVSGR